MTATWSSPLYIVRGALFLRSHRPLWKYAAAPLAMSIVILGGSYVLLYRLLMSLTSSLEHTRWYGETLYYLAVVVLILALFVVFFFLFGRIASALAGPFNEVLSRKTEEIATGAWNTEPFSLVELLKDSGRSLWHSLRLLGLYVIVLTGGLILLLIPVIGGFAYAFVTAITSAYLFSHEYLGYSMDRRRFSWPEKRTFVRSQPRSVIGFGLGVVVTASIPFINFLFIPPAVVGGTLLFLELNASGNANSRSKSEENPL